MSYVNFFLEISNYIEMIISQGGYVFLFIFTVLEGIPLIGMIVPGHIAIVFGGFLAKIGTIDLFWAIVVSIVGALVGDYLGFFIGRRYGMSFIAKLRPYFSVFESSIEKAQSLLSKHTGKALIVGRFTPATRALMPFLVGTTQTSPAKFWFFNVIGGVSWVSISVIVGYLFGTAYHLASRNLGKIFLVAVLFVFLIIWGYKFMNSRFHIFKKYELFTLILNILSLFSFALIVDKLISNRFKLGFDVWLSVLMDRLNHLYPVIVSISKIISEVGSTINIGIIGLILVILMLIKKRWRLALIMFLSICLTALSTGVLKVLFASSRPINSLIPMIGDPSFPSGHSSMAASLFIILAYIFACNISSIIKRELLITGCIIAIIIIGISRLVLNVHWFSDVVGGWSLGIFMATASILFVRYIGILVIKR